MESYRSMLFNRPYARELKLCQRYFYIYASTASSSYEPIGIGYTEPNHGVIVVRHRVEMRTQPTLYTSGNTTTNIIQTALSGGALTNYSCTGVSIYNGTSNISGRTSYLTFLSTLPAGIMNNIRFANSGTAGAIGFNAEL